MAVTCRNAVLALLVTGAAAFVGALPATAAAAAPDGCAAARATVARATLEQARRATLCLLNRARASRGLPALRLNRKLSAAAARHSHDMVRRRYFSHYSPDGRGILERIRPTGYLPRDAGYVLGENIGWGSGPLAAPLALVRAWMRSPGHRRNILDRRFRDIGIGIALGAPSSGDGWRAATYTTDFGRISR